MKRIICLLLATLLCLAAFTGCDQLSGLLGGGNNATDENIDNAHTFLSTKYKDLEGSHATDFDVVAQVVVAGVKYPVTWAADNDKVTIRESVKANHYTVDLPDDNAEEFSFTLTATIKSTTSSATKDKTFTIKVPAAAAEGELSILAAIELGKEQANSSYTTEKYYVSGTVKNITNDTFGNLYITDAEGNELLVYGTYDATGKTKFDNMTTKPQVGDTVTFYSVVGNYNGTPQLKNAWLVKLNGEELGTPDQGGNGGSSTAAAVLDMMGSTNIKSHSAEQLIYSANGITLTNDKCSSSTDCYNNKGSYAARFYGGATIKIEYTGMTKIVITMDDYSPDGSKTYMAGFDGMVVEGATFVRNNDVLTIYFAAATNEFHSTELASQVRIEQIEIFTGAVETPPAGGDNGGNNDNNGGSTGSYTAPVEGQAYKFYLEQGTFNKTLYFAGTMDAEKGTYLATTENVNAAVDIYFEAVNGGYHIYFMNGNTKTYLNAEAYLKSNGHAGCHFQLVSTPVCVWTYNTQHGILEVYGEVEGKSDTFFAGTYGSYQTISLSGAYFKEQISSGTQFPARIVISEGGNTEIPENPGTGNEGTETPENPGTGNDGGNTNTPIEGLPANLVFTGLVNKASADAYLKEKYPEWTITGKLGNGYGDYLGFGRSGDVSSAITSPTISVDSKFSVSAVIKGNGSNGVMTSTLTFTLVDASGNTIATGYANGSTDAAINPLDATDTLYDIEFTLVEGKTWSDVSNLVISFAKTTGNIGLKSVDFVQ